MVVEQVELSLSNSRYNLLEGLNASMFTWDYLLGFYESFSGFSSLITNSRVDNGFKGFRRYITNLSNSQDGIVLRNMGFVVIFGRIHS